MRTAQSSLLAKLDGHFCKKAIDAPEPGDPVNLFRFSLARIGLAAMALCLVSYLSASPAAGTNLSSMRFLAPFVLEDQHGNLHSINFPNTNLIVLTVADRASSSQVNSWIDPLKKRYAQRITILGIADMGNIPRPFRAFAKAKFKKAWEHPVMLDWEGLVVKELGYTKNQVNVLVVGRDGKILWRDTGAVNREALESLMREIDKSP